MRVTTGSAKGRKLQMTPGDKTRPITDRAKQALFSILGASIEDARVLDLFGGTGAVGIEALSRGADSAQFVELDRKAVETIRTNLRNCLLEANAQVTQGDSFAWLERYAGEPFDFIYIAPPQYQGLWHKALLLVDSRPQILSDDATVAVQIHPKESAPVDLDYLVEFDRRTYGSVQLVFYASAAEIEALREEDNDHIGEGRDLFLWSSDYDEWDYERFFGRLAERQIAEALVGLAALSREQFGAIAAWLLGSRKIDILSVLTPDERAKLEEKFEGMEEGES